MNTLPPRHAYAGRVLVAILLFNWSGLPAYICNAQNATESPSGAPSPASQQQAMAPESDKKPVAKPKPEELAKLVDDMEKSFKALEAAQKEIRRDTFDPQAIIDKIGKDPNKLFEWVRDNIYWVPYRGMLRGPIGVLMDRVGSSLDRSLLLAELLRVAGHKVQLAHVELTEEQAKQLLAKLRPVPQNPLPSPPSADRKKMEEQIEAYAAKYQLDAATLRTIMEQASLQTAKFSESVAKRVAEQVPIIAKAVGKPTAEQAQASRAKELSDQLTSLADHWWIQHQEEKSWVNLDPIVPDGRPGQTVTAAKPVITSSDEKGRFALDSKDCHEVDVRVVIEQWNNEATKEHVVLSQMLRPADLIGQQITLQHIPLNWPKDLNLFQEKEALTKLKATALTETEWLPILTVGSTPIYQSGFTDSGDTYDGAAKQLAKNWGLDKAAARVGGILGGGIIGGIGAKRTDEKKRTEGARLTAEWIEYDIHSPGQPDRKIRRQIFDLLGPSARLADKVAEPTLAEGRRLERGLTLMLPTEILPLVCQLSFDYVSHLAATKMLANRKALPGLLTQLASDDGKGLAEKMSKIAPLPGQLYNLALARHAASRFRGDVYLGSPNLLSFHGHVRHDATGDLRFCDGFDIVTNAIAVRPGADAFMVRLEQGVIDTNAESSLMTGCGKVESAAEFFASATGQGIEWIIVRSDRDPAWQNIELPGDIRLRAAMDLAAGYVVMVPKKAITFDGRTVVGWWRINPRTGETLGIGDQGWGQTDVEKMLITVTTGVFQSVAFAICVARAASLPAAGTPMVTLPGGAVPQSYVCGVGVCALAAAFGGLGLFVEDALVTIIVNFFSVTGLAVLPACG